MILFTLIFVAIKTKIPKQQEPKQPSILRSSLNKVVVNEKNQFNWKVSKTKPISLIIPSATSILMSTALNDEEMFQSKQKLESVVVKSTNQAQYLKESIQISTSFISDHSNIYTKTDLFETDYYNGELIII